MRLALIKCIGMEDLVVVNNMLPSKQASLKPLSCVFFKTSLPSKIVLRSRMENVLNAPMDSNSMVDCVVQLDSLL